MSMFKRLSAAFRHVSLLKNCLAALLLAASFAPAQAEDYLAPEVAFKFSAKMVGAKTVEIDYAIADGYYMYRDRFHFKAEGATLGEPVFPHGKVKFDYNFQKEVETYRNSVSVRIPVEATGSFKLTATGQGCADQGLCYPPMDTVATMSPDAVGHVVKAADAANPANADSVGGAGASDMDKIAAILQSGKLLAVLSLFFLFGIGLSFTPCVLPMVPILSSIIVGEGAQSSRGR